MQGSVRQDMIDKAWARPTTFAGQFQCPSHAWAERRDPVREVLTHVNNIDALSAIRSVASGV